ncbi:MAG: D-hexose-6-phosphate mutarotase [Verrucomicrobia bacterium]|nr:D-hexose-6-phosphate mutarotase [Verrucomicrobiota bacterium]
MTEARQSESAASSNLSGRVTFLDGNGGLPMIEVETPWSTAEIYLHGAQVTHFQRRNEPPVLFLSHVSRFAEGQPIRGGIPIVLPWFGPREGEPTHGFARLKAWELKDIFQSPDGSTSLRLRLAECAEAASFPPFTADYVVTVSEVLKLRLTITNASPEAELTFENCLHTYFSVGDVEAISLTGLAGVRYLDKCDNLVEKTEIAAPLKITQEVDRVYLDAPGAVEILDAKLRRRIRVEKTGSASTVLWNPWIAKAQQMPDFGNEEYQQMVCVESGNVGRNKITLPPGKSSTMKVTLTSAPA